MISSILRMGDYVIKLDINDAFLSATISRKSKIFLRVFWKGKLYQFICPLFGVASHRLFTKALKTSSGPSSISWYPDPDVSGQLTDNGRDKGTLSGIGANTYRFFC